MTGDEEERPKFSSRPEAPWAMWAGIAGGGVATVLSVKGLLASDSGAAAIGFIYVPFIAIAAILPCAVWGLAAGCVWLSLRGVQRYAPALLIAAWLFALAAPAVIGWELWRGR